MRPSLSASIGPTHSMSSKPSTGRIIDVCVFKCDDCVTFYFFCVLRLALAVNPANPCKIGCSILFLSWLEFGNFMVVLVFLCAFFIGF